MCTRPEIALQSSMNSEYSVDSGGLFRQFIEKRGFLPPIYIEHGDN